MTWEALQSGGTIRLALMFAFVSTSIASAQQIQVPYFLDDAIVVDSIINGKPARFLFDTGSSETAFFKSGVDRLDISTVSAGKIVIAGHEVERRGTDALDVTIFGKQIKQRFQVLPFQHTLDAVLGWRDVPAALLIDGRNRFVKQQHTLPPPGNWTEWKMETDNQQLFFLVMHGDQELGRVFIDTGVQSGLRLSPMLWSQWKEENKDHPTTLETFQYSVGEPMVSEVAWVHEYQLGDLTFRNLDIGLIPTAKDNMVVDAGGHQYVATIGTRALRHLRIVISRQTGEVWTETVTDVPSHNRLGAVFTPRRDGEVGLVCQVLPGTPAESAGLQNGDRLLEVNGIAFQDDDRTAFARMTHLFSQPAGTSVTIGVMRGESERTFVIELRDILQ